MAQQARNLVMNLEEGLGRFRFVLLDRDTKFTAVCDAIFAAEGIEVPGTPGGRRRRTPMLSGGWAPFGVRCSVGC